MATCAIVKVVKKVRPSWRAENIRTPGDLARAPTGDVIFNLLAAIVYQAIIDTRGQGDEQVDAREFLRCSFIRTFLNDYHCQDIAARLSSTTQMRRGEETALVTGRTRV